MAMVAAADPARYPADPGLYPVDPGSRDAIFCDVIFCDIISCDIISHDAISCDVISGDASPSPSSCDVIPRGPPRIPSVPAHPSELKSYNLPIISTESFVYS